MRRSRTAMTLMAAPLLVMAAAAGYVTASATTATTTVAVHTAADTAATFPAHYAAPYLQIDSSDVGDMTADMSATGDKYYTLAFLIPQSGCTPEWEDNGDAVGAFTSQVNSLKAAGGTAIISFGGESGGELAQTCTSVSSLTAATDPVAAVAARDALGGASPRRVREHARKVGARVTMARQWNSGRRAHIAEAESDLVAAARRLASG